MKIKELLGKLGFSEKESQVYMALIKLEKATPAELAKLTKIGRPTVYNIVKSLLSKGVIAEDKADKVLNLVALPSEGLRASVERSKVELLKQEEVVNAAIQELLLVASDKTYPVPKLRFIEEDELSDYLFQNASKWNKSVLTKDGIWHGFQDHTFVENYEDWIDWTVRKFQGTKYEVRLFSNISKIEEKLEGKIKERSVKFLKSSHFTATTWVVGDYLVMISTARKPFYLVEIYDELMADNMREVFRNMWALNN